jgi:hypothetical protein
MRELRAGMVWIVDYCGKLWKLDVATETFTQVANVAPMSQWYITSLAMDSSERYLYYCPGAHGTACNEGTPIFQYDLKTGHIKAICYLSPSTLTKGTGYICNGIFSLALSEDDPTLFVTWNGFRPVFPELTWVGEGAIGGGEGAHYSDVCAVSAIRIPVGERMP